MKEIKETTDRMKVVLDIVRRREGPCAGQVPIADIIHIANNRYGIKEMDCRRAIDDLLRKTSDIYEPKHGYVAMIKPPKPTEEKDCRDTCEQLKHMMDEYMTLKEGYKHLESRNKELQNAVDSWDLYANLSAQLLAILAKRTG